MNVQCKIVNVMIVGRTFTERSSDDHNVYDVELNVHLVIAVSYTHLTLPTILRV